MPRIAPLDDPAGNDETAQTFERLRDVFGEQPIPEPFLLYARCPAFLQDFYMNLKKHCLTEGKLDLKTKTIVALAVAGNAACDVWADFFATRLRAHGGDDQTLADVAGVASACSMYNVFFKFRDLSGSDLFGGMSVGLRAHTFAGTSLDERTVELMNVALSDINGCKPCTSGHVEKVRALGVSDDAILEAIQCAATMMAGIQFLKHAGA